MKTSLIILFITAVTIVSMASAFAVPQFKQSHPDAPSWIADVRRADPPALPAPAAPPVAEVATEPISYTDVALPVNDLPDPSNNSAVVQAPVQIVAQNFQPVEVHASESWYDDVEQYDVGNSYIAHNREQFDFHVAYRQVLPNGQIAAVPEPSSMIGLAAPVLGSLVYWRRRRNG